MTTFYDFTLPDIQGNNVAFEAFRGKLVLVVNTASKCGFTPQFEGLEKLYRDYKDRGFVILGFPCDQFAHQEPGNAEEIQNFCKLNYDVTFPMFTKIEVNGEEESPLYTWLKKQASGLFGCKAIKWNFTKFLIDRQGNVVKRYAPTKKPEALRKDIEKYLGSAL